MDNKIEKIKQGRKNRQAGAIFELRVRADLEKEGWIVAKWTNNVEFMCTHKEKCCARLVKVKNKFRGKGIPMMLGAGFPDFIAFFTDRNELLNEFELPFMSLEVEKFNHDFRANIIGVEVKSNGILKKEEKEKCKWLIDNNIFSKILIAKKSIKRGKIEYLHFKSKSEVQKMAEDEEEKKEDSEEDSE